MLAGVAGERDWDFAGAEQEFKRALELNPNYASGHQWYSEFLADMGRNDEALSEALKAEEADPLSLVIQDWVGMAYAATGHRDKAEAQLQRLTATDPSFPRTAYFGARVA